MTPEKCEKKAVHALRMLQGNTHLPTIKALKQLANDYTLLAALLWYERTHGDESGAKDR